MDQAQLNRFADHLHAHNLTIRNGRLESTVDPNLAHMKIRLEMIEAKLPTAHNGQPTLSEAKRTTAADELDLRARILAAETGIPFATAYVQVFDDNAALRKRYSQEQQMHTRQFANNPDTEG